MKKIYLLIIVCSFWLLPLQAMQSDVPSLSNLVPNAALYKKAAQVVDYRKLSEAINIFTPHIGVLLGNPEEDRLIYRDVVSAVVQNQRYLHPQFKDNPALADIMRQKPTVESKNPWFDMYDYYVKKYDADHYKARLDAVNMLHSFLTTDAKETKLYKKMLQELEVPLRKKLLMIPSLHAFSGAIGITYNDQIWVHKHLPFEQLRSTLYHEGQHLKYHDSPKAVLLLQTLLTAASTFPSKTEPLSAEDHAAILKKYHASFEKRTDHNTHHTHINCYKCNLSQAKFIKNEPIDRTTIDGYMSHEELQEISEKQKKQNLVCEHHRRWFFQNWFFDYLKT